MERNNHVTLGAATRFLTLCIPHSIKPRVKVSHIPFFLKYIRENIPFEVVKIVKCAEHVVKILLYKS